MLYFDRWMLSNHSGIFYKNGLKRPRISLSLQDFIKSMYYCISCYFQMMRAVYRSLPLSSIKKYTLPIMAFTAGLVSWTNLPREFACIDCFLFPFCRYLAALISQSFLDIGSVSRILDSIINMCLQLCRVIEQEDGTPNFVELERITEV